MIRFRGRIGVVDYADGANAYGSFKAVAGEMGLPMWGVGDLAAEA